MVHPEKVYRNYFSYYNETRRGCPVDWREDGSAWAAALRGANEMRQRAYRNLPTR